MKHFSSDDYPEVPYDKSILNHSDDSEIDYDHSIFYHSDDEIDDGESFIKHFQD